MSASSTTRDSGVTLVHVPKKGNRMKDRLDGHKSSMTTYRTYKDSEHELRFPLAVAITLYLLKSLNLD